MSCNPSIYSIGTISDLLKIPQYVLRYWEKEFKDFIVPKRTRGNQRRYSENDITMFECIKKMLYDDEYSIAGARKVLNKNDQNKTPSSSNQSRTTHE